MGTSELERIHWIIAIPHCHLTSRCAILVRNFTIKSDSKRVVMRVNFKRLVLPCGGAHCRLCRIGMWLSGNAGMGSGSAGNTNRAGSHQRTPDRDCAHSATHQYTDPYDCHPHHRADGDHCANRYTTPNYRAHRRRHDCTHRSTRR